MAEALRFQIDGNAPERYEEFVAPIMAPFVRAVLVAAFSAAGLHDVRTEDVVAEIRLPRLADFALGHLQGIPWGVVAAQARPDGLEAVTAAITQLLAARTAPDGSLSVPFASALVAGTR